MTLSKPEPRTLAALVIALTFVVGGLAGVATDRTMHLAQRRDAPGPSSPERMAGNRDRRERGRERFIQEMKRNLNLTPDQVTKIEAISRAREQKADSLLKDVRPKLHALLQETGREIDSVLTPAQRTRLHEIWRQKAEQRHKDGPGAPGPMADTTGGKR